MQRLGDGSSWISPLRQAGKVGGERGKEVPKIRLRGDFPASGRSPGIKVPIPISLNQANRFRSKLKVWGTRAPLVHRVRDGVIPEIKKKSQVQSDPEPTRLRSAGSARLGERQPRQLPRRRARRGGEGEAPASGARPGPSSAATSPGPPGRCPGRRVPGPEAARRRGRRRRSRPPPSTPPRPPRPDAHLFPTAAASACALPG